MSRSDDRATRNDVVFRDANEQIRAAREVLPLAGEPVPFICECEDPGCTAILRLDLVEYGSVREDCERFVIAPGHSHRGRVVWAGEGFEVVEGEAG